MVFGPEGSSLEQYQNVHSVPYKPFSVPGSNNINSTYESIPVQLQLEGEGGLDVPVEDVLLEIVESPEGLINKFI